MIIGIIAGWLAGLIMRGQGFGIVGNMIIGILGALIGGYLFDILNVTAGAGFWGSLGTSVVGAVVFLFLIRLVKNI